MLDHSLEPRWRLDSEIPLPDANPFMSEADSSSSLHQHAPHRHHEAISKRLKRAEGHLRSVVQMIEDGRNCVDIAQQLSAVEKAITQAKRTLIQDHLDHCLEDVVGSLPRSQRGPIDEFKTITKYL